MPALDLPRDDRGTARGGLEPAIAAGLAEKPAELIEAYASGKAQYYGMYKRTYDGEDVHFNETVTEEFANVGVEVDATAGTAAWAAAGGSR